jgi:hypothetical protein
MRFDCRTKELNINELTLEEHKCVYFCKFFKALMCSDLYSAYTEFECQSECFLSDRVLFTFRLNVT